MSFLKGFAWSCYLVSISLAGMAVWLINFSHAFSETASRGQVLAGIAVLLCAVFVIAIAFTALAVDQAMNKRR